MTVFEYIVEGEPVAVSRPKVNTITGHAYLPKKTQDALDTIQGDVWSKLVNEGRNKCIFPEGVPVKVTIDCFRAPCKKPKIRCSKPVQKPDLDNYIKILDSLNRVVYFDDNQITTIIARKRHGDPPRTVFRFEEDLEP